MVKRIIGGVLIFAIGAGAVFGYFAVAFAEPKKISLNGFATPLFIPAEIRETPQVGMCGEVLASLSWQECGGICGAIYRLDYPSTEPEKSVRDLVAEYVAQFPEYEATITTSIDKSKTECGAYSIEYFTDFRTK